MSNKDLGLGWCAIVDEQCILVWVNVGVPSFYWECEVFVVEFLLGLSSTEDNVVTEVTSSGDWDEGEIPQ